MLTNEDTAVELPLRITPTEHIASVVGSSYAMGLNLADRVVRRLVDCNLIDRRDIKCYNCPLDSSVSRMAIEIEVKSA